MAKGKQLSFEIGDALHRRLKVKSALTGRPMSAIVIELIESALIERDDSEAQGKKGTDAQAK